MKDIQSFINSVTGMVWTACEECKNDENKCIPKVAICVNQNGYRGCWDGKLKLLLNLSP